MNTISFGEILWDVYDDKKYIGGAPLNFAAHLAKHGNEVYMLSSLGKDELGTDALEQLKEWGIKTDYISLSDSRKTGCCLVTLDKDSQPSYNLLNDVAYDYIECDNISRSFDVLYFGTMALRSEFNLNQLRSLLNNNRFGEIFVDVNIRPPFYTYETVEFSIRNATILKISLEELSVIQKLLEIDLSCDYRNTAKILSERYANLSLIIITLGADGAFVFDCKEHTEYTRGCEKTVVKSTVGAGDSFSAAFLHQYMQNADIQAALEYAVKIAAYVVSQIEAVPDYDLSVTEK